MEAIRHYKLFIWEISPISQKSQNKECCYCGNKISKARFKRRALDVQMPCREKVGR